MGLGSDRDERPGDAGYSPHIDAIAQDLTESIAERLVDEQVEIARLAALSDASSATTAQGTGQGTGQGHVTVIEQLIVGRWLNEAIAGVNRDRIRVGEQPLDASSERLIRSRVAAELTGSGPLEVYLCDPSVEEIDVNSHLTTWVSYTDGRKVDVGQLWSSPAHLTAFQKRLARRMSVTGEGRLDTSSPTLTLQTRDGSRVVMVLGGPDEHGISTQPRLAIRRYAIQRVGLGGLAQLGLMPMRLVPILSALVRCGFTILISGPPGAGKTTLLTELLGEVSASERIITVERHLLELRLEDDPRHPDAPALFTRRANAEGAGEVTTRELVELTRRLNPDRVVVGELVEDEALEMLDVASMCARGSLATIHAHTADIVLARLAYYVAKSQTALPEYAVWSLIAQTVDFVIHIDLVRNTSWSPEQHDPVDRIGQRPGKPVRRITSIIEVGGRAETGAVATTEIWQLDSHHGLAMVAPLSVAHRRRLESAGFRVDELLGSEPLARVVR
jgi:Flp pilus assembly CpaF family ATPase